MGLSNTNNLNIFTSSDTATWGLLNAQTSYCTGCVRDPSIKKFGSTYQLVHTCEDATGDLHRWCRSSSTDLQSWVTLQGVDTSALSSSLHIYAPEWVANTDGTPYIDGGGCPHVTMTATNGSTTYASYESHPTDCSDFTQPWSTPVLLSVTGEDHPQIDTFMVCVGIGGGNCTGFGDTFFLWYERLVLNTTEYTQYASASTLTGTFTRISNGGDWANFGAPTQEGPALIRLFNGTSYFWRLFFDRVPDPPGDLTNGQINYSDSSDNWATWTSPNPITSAPLQAKHGTVIPR